jgi:hypothetical protein
VGLAAGLAALLLGSAALAAPLIGARDGSSRAPSGLAFSSASALVVQPQPRPGSCHAIGVGLFSRPDPRCAPGTLNPAVTQASIGSTICRSGWTSVVRPPESVTAREKRASMAAYGISGATRGYEYDHVVPLELGGALNDARNLWPEPDYASRGGFYLNPKDRLENALKRLVCARRLTLAQAQREIAGDWVAAYRRRLAAG